MLSLYDTSRQRPVAVDIAVRRDVEVQAQAGMLTMPVVVINHGNTVRFTEYSFLSNYFAARGYLAISIQHDLASDAPLVTKVGEEYVGRMPVYQRWAANITFALGEVAKRLPHADYNHLTLVGHSNGGDISMYFAELHPDLVKKVITLDNLRVPLQGAFKILSFRSKDPNFVPDPGVVPSEEVCKKTGVTVVNTKYRHTDMSDRGPDSMKESIEGELGKFLKDDNSDLAPVNTDQIEVPVP
jgi:pimeloyl-ACP methyl ester carboxylesterase